MQGWEREKSFSPHRPSVTPRRGELQSFLVEITSIILNKKDDKAPGYIVDKIVDQARHLIESFESQPFFFHPVSCKS